MTKDDLPPLPLPVNVSDDVHLWGAPEMVAYARAAIAAHDSQAARERDIAEDALLRKGYRKSCDIPACNCGDQWNHGGHANARLYEVSEALMQADCRRNGETILADVVHICAENERLRDIAAHDAKREKDADRIMELARRLENFAFANGQANETPDRSDKYYTKHADAMRDAFKALEAEVRKP